jgi:hypothetical protein
MTNGTSTALGNGSIIIFLLSSVMTLWSSLASHYNRNRQCQQHLYCAEQECEVGLHLVLVGGGCLIYSHAWTTSDYLLS